MKAWFDQDLSWYAHRQHHCAIGDESSCARCCSYSLVGMKKKTAEMCFSQKHGMKKKLYMGVSKNRGTPKWMVYMENPIKMDDLGVPSFKETSIIILYILCIFFLFFQTRYGTTP